MKDAWPYPLPESALNDFCHPADWHLLNRPMRIEREIVAANGYLSIRAERGGWIDSEFPAASAEFMGRVGKLPWSQFPASCELWRPLAPVMSRMGIRGGISPWLNGRLAPSPVWRVGSVLVRLSLLQLVARLPRVEVNWRDDKDSPLWVRFSGGRGIIAKDATLTRATFSVMQPATDELTGELVPRTAPRPALRLVQPGVNWPPADLSDI